MEIIKESSKTLVAAASLLCLCVACKPNTHLLAGKSYGVVDAANAISANDLLEKSPLTVEQELLGKVVTLKDLQATEVGAIDTSKNACQYEFDAISAPKEKIGIQLRVQFNRTPSEIKDELRHRFQNSEALDEIIPDSTLFDETNVPSIPDPLCKGQKVFDCTTNERVDFKRCPFETGKFHVSGKVFSVQRSSVSKMVIYMLPTGYSSGN